MALLAYGFKEPTFGPIGRDAERGCRAAQQIARGRGVQREGPEAFEHQMADARRLAPVDVGIVEEGQEGGIRRGRVGGGEGLLEMEKMERCKAIINRIRI
jgi:hypothetical protein